MSAAIESLRALPEVTENAKLRNSQLLSLNLRAPTPLLSKNGFNVVAFSPAGDYIATAGREAEVEVWSLDGQCLQRLSNIQASVLCVACSPDRQELAGGLHDGTVAVWTVRNSQPPQLLLGHERRVTSITYFKDTLLTASQDMTVRMWERPFSSSQVLLTHQNYVRSITVQATILASAGYDSCVFIYDLVGKVCVQEFRHHLKRLHAVALAPDGETVASSGAERTIYLWTVGNDLFYDQLVGHLDAVNALAFSPGGDYLFSGSYDGCFSVWSVETKTRLKTVEELGRSITRITAYDSLVVYGCSKTSCFIWQTDKLLEAKQPERGWFLAVSVSPCGQRIITGGEDGSVTLWSLDLEHKRVLCKHKSYIQFVKICGEYFISLSEDGNLKRYSMSTETFRDVLVTSTRSIGCAPDGKHIAVIDSENKVSILELHSLECTQQVDEVQEALHVLFSPCGTQLAYSSKLDELKVFNLARGTTQTGFSMRTKVTSVAFSPCGQYLAVSGMNYVVALFSAVTGDNLSAQFTRGPPLMASGRSWQFLAWRITEDVVSSLIYSPDGRFLVYASHDNHIAVVCIDSNSSIQLTGHSDVVTSIAFSEDSHFLASVSRDSTVKVWNIRKVMKPFLSQ